MALPFEPTSHGRTTPISPYLLKGTATIKKVRKQFFFLSVYHSDDFVLWLTCLASNGTLSQLQR